MDATEGEGDFLGNARGNNLRQWPRVVAVGKGQGHLSGGTARGNGQDICSIDLSSFGQSRFVRARFVRLVSSESLSVRFVSFESGFVRVSFRPTRSS